MITEYVNKKSELTTKIGEYEKKGYVSYRSRTVCACVTGNRRDCVLLVNHNCVGIMLIRCKSCAGKEATNGNV